MISIDIELQRQIDKLTRRLDDLATRDRPGGIRCLVYRNTVQALTGAGNLQWNTEVYDTAEMWAIGTPDKIYAPLDGQYVFGASWQMAAAQITASDKRIAMYILHRNAGGTAIANYSGQIHITANGIDTRQSVAAGAYMLKGESIEAAVSHDFGVSKDITAAISTSFVPNYGWMMKAG